jgi:hypothetical protein
MDPEQALRDARAALRMIRSGQADTQGMAEATEELANAFEDLDGWLSKGGFLPKAWNTESGTPESHESAPWTDQD